MKLIYLEIHMVLIKFGKISQGWQQKNQNVYQSQETKSPRDRFLSISFN